MLVSPQIKEAAYLLNRAYHKDEKTTVIGQRKKFKERNLTL